MESKDNIGPSSPSIVDDTLAEEILIDTLAGGNETMDTLRATLRRNVIQSNTISSGNPPTHVPPKKPVVREKTPGETPESATPLETIVGSQRSDRRSDDEFNFSNFSKSRSVWTDNDEKTLHRMLQQVQGCAKLVGMANSRYRAVNRVITGINAFSSVLLTVLNSNMLYNASNNTNSGTWVSVLATVFSSIQLVLAGLDMIYHYGHREIQCIQMEDRCATLQESIRNTVATPLVNRHSPTFVLQKIIKRYLEIRRAMVSINIIADHGDSYKKIVEGLKNKTDESKEVYLTVIDEFGTH